MHSSQPHRPTPERAYAVDRLQVEVYADRQQMGEAAAHDVAQRMRTVLQEQARLVMVFAAAPSQNEFLAALGGADGIAWGRVTAFHMDEYCGLSTGAPQSFGRFLRERLFERVRPGAVHYIAGDAADPAAECRRYAALLAEQPTDIVCLGIGENGHLAFNDPGLADFEDAYRVKPVALKDSSRQQQVHDGCFPDLAAVPAQAITLTIPALVAARWMFCMVPGPTKTAAVQATLGGPITDQCPATILRRHTGATLYLDRAAAGI